MQKKNKRTKKHPQIEQVSSVSVEESSPLKYAKALDTLIRIGLKSPRKQRLVSTVVASHSKRVFNTVAHEVSILNTLRYTNRKKEYDSLRRNLLIRFGTRQKISEASGVKYHKIKKLFGWLRSRDNITKRSKDAKRRVQGVHTFFREGAEAISLPDRRLAGKKFLTNPLKLSYPMYRSWCKSKSIDPLSFKAFCKKRPSDIKRSCETPRRMCVCEKCENASLKQRALHGHNFSEVPYSIIEALKKTWCTIPEGKYWAQNDCINRQCKKCGTKLLRKQIINNTRFLRAEPKKNVPHHNVPHRDVPQQMKYHQWVRIGTQFYLVEKVCKPLELLNAYLLAIHNVSRHTFIAAWQGTQFRHMRSNFKKGTIVQVMDFGQNYLNIFQDEIQSMHWDHQQTTIHPIVNYYKCPCCVTKTVTHEQIFITPCKKHNHFAVTEFQKVSLREMRSYGVEVNDLCQVTDNCNRQYKSKGPFEKLANDEVPITRFYFGARHGKNEADGATGRVKQAVHLARTNRLAVVRDAKDFYDFCKTKLERKPVIGECHHYTRTFHYLGTIDATSFVVLDTGIVGTNSFHQVRSSGIERVIEARNTGCLCSYCYYGIGECPNRAYVDMFQMYKQVSSAVFGRNKHFPLVRQKPVVCLDRVDVLKENRKLMKLKVTEPDDILDCSVVDKAVDLPRAVPHHRVAVLVPHPGVEVAVPHNDDEVLIRNCFKAMDKARNFKALATICAEMDLSSLGSIPTEIQIWKYGFFLDMVAQDCP